jgi:CheY-like chemotaxis protein
MVRQSILIADGDAELCVRYRKFFKKRGYQTEISTDGLDCVRTLRHRTPDVLLLDLELRWGGGDGVLGWLNEEPQFLPGRVILTATEASANLFDRLASPPVVKTLKKPFPLSTLLDGPAFNALDGIKHSSNGSQRRGILVVDRESADRDRLQSYLQDHGFHVWTAESGEQALDHCCDRGEQILVVLLESRQAHDGLQTLEGIRAYNADIPVCFMAGDTCACESNDLLSQGVHRVFGKPLQMDEIVHLACDLANEGAS